MEGAIPGTKRARSSSAESSPESVGSSTSSQQHVTRRAQNKLIPPPDADFSCIHEGCSKKCGDKTKWRNHIKNGIHKQAWADLPDIVPKGRTKYTPLPPPAVDHPLFDARGQPYSKHKLLPTPDANFTCCFAPCTRTLSNFKEWRNHITKHRVQFSQLPFAKKGFICDEDTHPSCCCLKLFKTTEELNKHRGEYVPVAAAPSTPPEDKGAWRIFPDAMPHPDDPGKVICHICYKSGVIVSYDKLGSLRAHWRSAKVHPGLFESFPLKAGTDIRTYLCAPGTNPACACGRVFDHKQKWDSHRGATFPCSKGCGAIFSNTSDRGKHEKKHCASLEDSYVCGLDGCTHVSPTPGALELHQRGPVHVVPDRVYVCSRATGDGAPCPYRHQHPSKVEQHEREVHGEDRPYVCGHTDGDEVCNAAFKTNGDLRKHQGVHVATYDLPCLTCQKLFKTPRLRHLHMTNTHGPERFPCPHCDRTFRVKVARDQHELTHSEERTYLCSLCDSSFKQKTVLDNHVQYVHTHSRDHVCETCGQCFHTPALLSSHCRIHVLGYTPGRSEGECAIHSFLQARGVEYQSEHAPPGHRFRFDFACDGKFVEYDGCFHFMPSTIKTASVSVFLNQVASDTCKSRYCRESDVPLLRLSGKLTCADDFNRSFDEAEASPADFSDYVMGHTLTGSFGSYLRTSFCPRFTGPSLEYATSLVLSCTTLSAVPLEPELSENLEALHAPVLLIFLRENAGNTAETIVADYGLEVLDACRYIASFMPEFGGVCESPLGRVVRKKPQSSASVTVRPLVQPRDPFVHCWICDVQFTNKPEAADCLLRHVNSVHNLNLLVKCEWCSRSYACQAERVKRDAIHDEACNRPMGTQKLVKSSQCSLCETVFGTRHRLLRHFNEEHSAQFSKWITLSCPDCKVSNFESLPEFERHVCH